MSYDPTTDFLGLFRNGAGPSVAPLEMPGLDFFISALARMGFISLSVGQTAPVANQETTVWFQPALPTYAAEGVTWLWNTGTLEYEIATPALWGTFLTHLSVSAAVAPLLLSPTIPALRTAMGLGSIATQDADAVAITGGTVTGVTIAGSVINGMFGDVAVVPLTNAPVTLINPPAIARFTGALTADVTVTIPQSGFLIVENLTTGAHVVKLASSAPGKIICAPPGEAVHVYCDGVDMKYVDLGRIGSYLDIATTGLVPAWIGNCTVPPFLNCNGDVFSALTYPALAALLGGTTLPDFRGRIRAALNQGTNRITAAGSGINGDVVTSAGGAEMAILVQGNLPAANLAVTDNRTWALSNDVLIPAGVIIQPTAGGGGTVYTFQAPSTLLYSQVSPTGLSIVPAGGAPTAALGGASTPVNKMPPTAIGGITLIRAG